MEFSEEWRYFKTKTLRKALSKMKFSMFGLLLNPEKAVKDRPICGESCIHDCPFRFRARPDGPEYCLAAKKMIPRLKVRGRDCFLLYYCREGHKRYLNIKAWKRRIENVTEERENSSN